MYGKVGETVEIERRKAVGFGMLVTETNGIIV